MAEKLITGMADCIDSELSLQQLEIDLEDYDAEIGLESGEPFEIWHGGKFIIYAHKRNGNKIKDYLTRKGIKSDMYKITYASE